jgi:Flp pilus assembly protein TadD
MTKRTVEHLLADVNFALEREMSARDLVPMLKDLLRCAPVGSDISRFARLELARQLLETQPFRAASLARSVTQEQRDDEAFGLLGLALTLLGCFRAAATAHRRACLIAPEHPGHAHNLGHLLDAAFGRPMQAVPWLERAFKSAPDVPQIASSYAHALVGVGRVDEARAMLQEHARLDAELAAMTVQQWLSPPACTRETG